MVMDAIYRSRSIEAIERKMKLLIAIELIAATMSTASAQDANDLPYGFAQSQQPDIVKLKEEAQNAFNVISSDKLKIQTFCKMADLGNKLDQADRANDTKKTAGVSQRLDELERKLPEYTALVDGLPDVDPNSADGQEIGSIILKLDELCG
jgi:hypothetical protein